MIKIQTEIQKAFLYRVKLLSILTSPRFYHHSDMTRKPPLFAFNGSCNLGLPIDIEIFRSSLHHRRCRISGELGEIRKLVHYMRKKYVLILLDRKCPLIPWLINLITVIFLWSPLVEFDFATFEHENTIKYSVRKN